MKNSLILKGYFEDQRTSLLLLLKWNFSGGGWKPRRCSTLPKMLTSRSVSTFEVDEHLQEARRYPGSQNEPAKRIPQPWPSYLKETLTLVR